MKTVYFYLFPRISALLLFISTFFLSISYSQTLEAYLDSAAMNNPGLKAKYKTFEASMEKVAQVGGLPDPNLSFGYFVSPVETRVGPQRSKFSLTQMFPWFGTLRAQEEAASLIAEAKYQEFLEARNKLFYQVAAFYYPLFELNRLMVLEEENLRVLSSYKDIATVKFQNGKVEMVDVLRTDIMLKEARTNLSILKQKKKPLETRFKALVHLEDTEPITVQDSLSVKNLLLGYRRDSLLADNPLINELELKMKASEASEQVAIKQALPKFGVGLDYVVVGQRTDIDLPDNGKDVFMPMVTLNLPIYGGKNRAAKREAQLMQESFALQKEDMSDRLSSSYDMVWFEIQKQADFITLYTQQIQTSNQMLNLLFSAYSNSGKDFEEVLRMQQQLLKYQKMRATALAEYHIALAELDYITAK
ncbi:TolC family protein [Flammeovirgaceae bacterium SG7u.111]|nr:TolC family protein [Flammeovirgaceae bacterium SG7u.132]WPO38689.1 TolC family protein [Flammeovirgaceae bacterium SG7u.111]